MPSVRGSQSFRIRVHASFPAADTQKPRPVKLTPFPLFAGNAGVFNALNKLLLYEHIAQQQGRDGDQGSLNGILSPYISSKKCPA